MNEWKSKCMVEWLKENEVMDEWRLSERVGECEKRWVDWINELSWELDERMFITVYLGFVRVYVELFHVSVKHLRLLIQKILETILSYG